MGRLDLVVIGLKKVINHPAWHKHVDVETIPLGVKALKEKWVMGVKEEKITSLIEKSSKRENVESLKQISIYLKSDRNTSISLEDTKLLLHEINIKQSNILFKHVDESNIWNVLHSIKNKHQLFSLKQFLQHGDGKFILDSKTKNEILLNVSHKLDDLTSFFIDFADIFV